MDNLKSNLWKNNKKLSNSKEEIVLEQYKLYVEMADRISERRDKVNNFFLALNTFAIGGIGFLLEKKLVLNPKWLIVLPLIILLGISFFWWRLVKSYRQLNSIKFDLIGDIEKKLPLKLWLTEWKLLGEGKDSQKYAPFSHVEQNLPVAFAIIYLIMAIIYFFTK